MVWTACYQSVRSFRFVFITCSISQSHSWRRLAGWKNVLTGTLLYALLPPTSPHPGSFLHCLLQVTLQQLGTLTGDPFQRRDRAVPRATLQRRGSVSRFFIAMFQEWNTDISSRHHEKIAYILPSILQAIWNKKLSEVSNLQADAQRAGIYHYRGLLSWYKSNSVWFFFFLNKTKMQTSFNSGKPNFSGVGGW